MKWNNKNSCLNRQPVNLDQHKHLSKNMFGHGHLIPSTCVILENGEYRKGTIFFVDVPRKNTLGSSISKSAKRCFFLDIAKPCFAIPSFLATCPFHRKGHHDQLRKAVSPPAFFCRNIPGIFGRISMARFPKIPWPAPWFCTGGQPIFRTSFQVRSLSSVPK